MTPEKQIGEVKKNYYFAVMQWVMIKNRFFSGRTGKSNQKYKIIIPWTIGDETRTFEWTGTEADLEIPVTNQLRAALAIAVILIDSVLENRFGAKPLEDTDIERKAARCIIHKLRCAYAHNPLEPNWEEFPQKSPYRRVFSIPSINYSLDLAQLSGKPLDYMGLLNWFKLLDLMDYCAGLVSRQSI